MVKRLLGVAMLLAAPLASFELGCGDTGGSGAGPDVDCEAVTPKGYGQLGFAFTSLTGKCTSCHDSSLTTPTDRQAAPVANDYETYALATQWTERICVRTADGTMPPAGSIPLTDAEETDILNWCSCGAPQ